MFRTLALVCLVNQPCDYHTAKARIPGPIGGLPDCLLGAESMIASAGLQPGEYVKVVCEAGVREARR